MDGNMLCDIIIISHHQNIKPSFLCDLKEIRKMTRGHHCHHHHSLRIHHDVVACLIMATSSTMMRYMRLLMESYIQYDNRMDVDPFGGIYRP